MENIVIHTESIQLDQLLKWAGIAESGGQGKLLLEDKLVMVNGHLETARRRRLFVGDTVEVKGAGSWKVASEPGRE